MKVVERIFENRIRQQIDIDDMQFGFMKGKGTTDAIFIIRQYTQWESAFSDMGVAACSSQITFVTTYFISDYDSFYLFIIENSVECLQLCENICDAYFCVRCDCC